MEKTVEIVIKTGNDLIPLNAYAVRTNNGELLIGYYNDGVFKSIDKRKVGIDDIVAFADIESLENVLNCI